jgi:hypothetical protein
MATKSPRELGRDCREGLLRQKTEISRGEDSRFKAGCSQDWQPHKALGLVPGYILET